MAQGNAESVTKKGHGKPGAGEPHARFDERGLETERPSWDRRACTDPAWTAPDDHRHRASPLLYLNMTTRCTVAFDLLGSLPIALNLFFSIDRIQQTQSLTGRVAFGRKESFTKR